MPTKATSLPTDSSVLDEGWERFLKSPEARLAIWTGNAEGSFAVENSIQEFNNRSTTDLILLLTAPFADSASFGKALSEDIQARYSFAKGLLESRGLRTDWTCTESDDNENPHRTLARTCVNFVRHHGPALERLMLFLTPSAIADERSYEKWLAQLIAGNIPESIRFATYEADERPRLARIREANNSKVLCLNFETAKGQCAESDPAQVESQVGRHIAAMSSYAAQKDLGSVDREAMQAIDLCKRHEWPHLGTSVLMLLGSAYLTADRADLALQAYGRAVRAAEAAAQQGRPEAPSLIVMSKTAEATCLFQAEDFPRATEAYADIAPLAEKNENTLAAFESWRMLAFCRQQAGDYEGIWQAAGKAFAASEKLDPEIRQATLPYFGKSLLQAAGDDRTWADKVEAKMKKLVGDDWQDLIPTAPPA
ncbi:hypothetical protein K2Y11_18465 [bacterium]|nr:hypothetical protein [bacterium]